MPVTDLQAGLGQIAGVQIELRAGLAREARRVLDATPKPCSPL
jgi:hypothetical protein